MIDMARAWTAAMCWTLEQWEQTMRELGMERATPGDSAGQSAGDTRAKEGRSDLLGTVMGSGSE